MSFLLFPFPIGGIYVSSMEGNELVAGFDTINGKYSQNHIVFLQTTQGKHDTNIFDVSPPR